MSRNLAVINDDQRALSAVDMRSHVNLVQEVMQAVMKKETHYGVIPGTKKPSLYKPGAEVLAATFRIAVSYRVEDLSADGEIRYRVTAIGTHQTTGVVLGEGMGECSSGEEKYKWRRAVCQEEFDLTPENRRRIKFSKYQGRIEKTMQVRAEAADLANTILKMACKRAQVAMTLNVTAASDIFSQDIEDLPEELRGEDEAPQTVQQPSAQKPAGQEIPAGTGGSIGESPLRLIRAQLDKAGLTDAECCKHFGIEKLENLTMDKINTVFAWIQNPNG